MPYAALHVPLIPFLWVVVAVIGWLLRGYAPLITSRPGWYFGGLAGGLVAVVVGLLFHWGEDAPRPFPNIRIRGLDLALGDAAGLVTMAIVGAVVARSREEWRPHPVSVMVMVGAMAWMHLLWDAVGRAGS